MDSFLTDNNPYAPLARRYLAALLRMDVDGARREIAHAMDLGTPLQALYLDVLAATQYEVGRLWETGQVSVAQEHYCTAASQTAMAMLSAQAFTAPRNGQAMLAACVDGNLHEFGLRVVADFFEMAGWRTAYLGAGVPGDCIADAVAAAGANVVALSASLDAHVPAIEEVVRALRADRRTTAVSILVGGHPFNADAQLWRQVGANGHASDAGRAVKLAERFAGVAA